jgi:hypothetical protein
LKLKQNPKMQISVKPKETSLQQLKRLIGFDVFRCPFRKKGTMHPVEELPRGRSPDRFYALTAACRS